MKKILLLISFVGICNLAYCQDTTKNENLTSRTVTGIVKDKNGTPIPGAIIKAKIGGAATVTDVNGSYSLRVPFGSKINVQNVGYTSQDVDVAGNTANVTFDDGAGGGSFSPKSYWVGASVGYNVNQTNSSSANSIVGGASVSINPITTNSKNWTFSIVGNIGNFVSTQGATGTNTGAAGSTANPDFSNLSKLSQSASGLNVGISATYTLPSLDTVNSIRLFGSTRYQLNSFQNAGDTTGIGLSQWKNTVGIEYEGLQFKNGGKFHVGLAGTIGFFDSNTFEKIFMKQKSSLASLDASIILPLSGQFGFLLEGTYSQYTTPVYLIGIIIRTTQAK